LNTAQFYWADENRFAEGDKTGYKVGMSPIKRTSHAVYDLKYHMVCGMDSEISQDDIDLK
jgi:hypothetical protein